MVSGCCLVEPLPEKTLIAPDVQRAVLGPMLLDNSLLNGPFSHLAFSDFVGTHDQQIFEAISACARNGKPFGPQTLADYLRDSGRGPTTVRLRRCE
jgi:replicative DNA helicase